MNNKGFTMIELLASFVLTMVIVVFLFEVVLSLKDVYVNQTTKTEIISKNAVIATSLNKSLSNSSNISCGSTSCSIDETSVIIEADKIVIGSQKIIYPNGISIDLDSIDLKVVKEIYTSENDNSYIKISYKILGGNYTDDILFNYVYAFNS